jgi:hypothetical protein
MSDRTIFDQASRLSEEGFFHEAARVWKGLVDEYPHCGNYRYHYAVCLLHSGEPIMTIEKQLSLSISSSGALISGSGKYNEDKCDAPVDVLVYAAQVKMLLLEFDEAKNLLSRFNVETKKWNPLRRKADLLKRNIDSAPNFIANPIDVTVTNMGPLINSEFDDTHPVIRADEKQLFFTSHRARSNGSNHGYFDPNSKEHYGDIYVVDRDTSWGEAEWINIGLKKHKYAVAISPFGESLTVSHLDGWDESIYRANKSKGKWQNAISSTVIPDAPSEGVIVFSPNNSFAIMSIADRKGRTGFDLYQYNLLSNGSWSLPERIEGPINSDGDEITPFISADGTLFFASNGQSSMGGYDCFSSVLKNGVWSTPLNLGYPINTVDDDSHFAISAEGTRAYIASRRNRPLNDYDLFEITFTDKSQLVNSNIMLLNSLIEEDVDRIILTSLNSGTTTDVGVLVDDNQYLRAILYGGQSYKIDYQKDGVVLMSEKIEISTDAGYHLFTDTIDSDSDSDSDAGWISEEGVLLVEKYVEPVEPEEPEEVEFIENIMSTKDSLELLSLLGQSFEEESWVIFYKLTSRQIHTCKFDISAMAEEAARRIKEDSHPQIFITSSAFKTESQTFEEVYKFSGKRAANIFIRMKSILSEMGYNYKEDYSFISFEIQVVTDAEIDIPDYVKIEITSTSN